MYVNRPDCCCTENQSIQLGIVGLQDGTGASHVEVFARCRRYKPLWHAWNPCRLYLSSVLFRTSGTSGTFGCVCDCRSLFFNLPVSRRTAADVWQSI